jgi:hypothetical protein
MTKMQDAPTGKGLPIKLMMSLVHLVTNYIPNTIMFETRRHNPMFVLPAIKSKELKAKKCPTTLSVKAKSFVQIAITHMVQLGQNYSRKTQ